MKNHIRILVLYSMILVGIMEVSAFEYPKDMPTFEALMGLHKKVKANEDEAMANVAASYGEQTTISKITEKYNEYRTTLDTKLNNAYSYIILAGAISTTARGLYDLAEEYKDFTVNTYKYVKKKPFLLWYYGNANNEIAREVKHCYKLYAIFAASGVNVWRATMSEKLELIFTLHDTVSKMRQIIYRANLYCKLMVSGDWKPNYIWEILNSEVTNEIAKAVIAQWPVKTKRK
jgi:hypothetical protein